MSYPINLAGPGGVHSLPITSTGDNRKELLMQINKYFVLDKTDIDILLSMRSLSFTAHDLLLKSNRHSKMYGIDSTMNSFVRDLPGKNRSKPPQMTDPYMTNRKGDLISRFRPILDDWLGVIAQLWKDKGWPLKSVMLGSHSYTIPDTTAFLEWDANALKDVLTNRDDYNMICETVADADALSRFTIQRYVRPFWYVRRYDANTKPIKADHALVLGIMEKALRHFATSAKGKLLGKDEIDKSADPFGTNTGWPLFMADYKGKDAKYTALAIADTLADRNNRMPLLHKLKYRDVTDYASRFRDIANSITGLTANIPLFTVQPSRRMKPGNKYVPDFEDRINGKLMGMIRGVPDQRLVYMFSYIHNLISAHPAAILRSWKKGIIGMSHDDEGKRAYSSALQGDYLCLLENDAGGFDANISHNHILSLSRSIGSALSHQYDKQTIAELISDIVRAPLIIPSPFSSQLEPTGLVLEGARGLESGSKWTGEIGSFMTKWMNCVAYLRLGWVTPDDIFNHLIGHPLPTGRLQLISGDDNTHIIKDAKEIKPLSDSLKQVYDEFGVKADLEFSDRFLMRHVRGMLDTPVAGRIFQQRASNEKVPSDQFTAAMGWLSAVENFSQITFSPAVDARKRTGRSGSKDKWVSQSYLAYQRNFLHQLLSLNSDAIVQLPFVNQLSQALSGKHSSYNLDNDMQNCAAAMMRLKLNTGSGNLSALAALLQSMLKDINSPSISHQLNLLISTNKDAKRLLQDMLMKGSQFQRTIIRTMGLIT